MQIPQGDPHFYGRVAAAAIFSDFKVHFYGRVAAEANFSEFLSPFLPPEKSYQYNVYDEAGLV